MIFRGAPRRPGLRKHTAENIGGRAIRANVNRRILLVEKPTGRLRPEHFRLTEAPLPTPKNGEGLPPAPRGVSKSRRLGRRRQVENRGRRDRRPRKHAGRADGSSRRRKPRQAHDQKYEFVRSFLSTHRPLTTRQPAEERVNSNQGVFCEPNRLRRQSLDAPALGERRQRPLHGFRRRRP